MKFLKKIYFIFVFAIMFGGVFHTAFGQEERLLDKKINFSIGEISFKNSDPKEYTGEWSLSFKGDAHLDKSIKEGSRSASLILSEIGSQTNQITLSQYDLSLVGSSFKLNTLHYAKSKNGFITIPWLTYGKSYELYFKGLENDEILSQKISLPTQGLKPPVVKPNLTIRSVTPKKRGSKKYFEVVFDINKTKKDNTGKPDRINVSIVDINNKNIGSLGSYAFFKGDGAVLPQELGILERIGVITSGSKYSLKFTDSQGREIHPQYQIVNTSFEGKVKENNNSFEGIYNEAERETIQEVKEGGLVGSNRCGYNLADPNNRICGFNDFMYMINKIISYIMVLILPIAALVFAYAGYLYLTSGGDVNKRNAAKRAMKNLAIGVLIILCAWVIVRAILISLGVTDEFFIFFQK